MPQEGGVPALPEPFSASQAPAPEGLKKECYKHISECTAGHAGLGFHVFNIQPVLWVFRTPGSWSGHQ